MAARWPAAVGLLAAAVAVLAGGDRDTVATALFVALTCYLAAAALDRPWVAWAAVPVASVVVAIARIARVELWITTGVAALAMITFGLLRGASRPALLTQSLGLLGYGALAVSALYLAPTAGTVLVSGALILHGVWDVVHYRRNAVVPRSLAEFCVFLDVPCGLAVIVLTLA